MDAIGDDERYPLNPYRAKSQQNYGSNRHRLHVANAASSRAVDDQYVDNEDEDDDDEEVEHEVVDKDGEDNQNTDMHYMGKDVDEEEEVDGAGEDDEDDDEKSHIRKIADSDNNDDEEEIERHPIKQKLKSLVSSYEFAPRVPAPAVTDLPVPKPSAGGRNPLTDWTEHETLVLLDAWGDKFLQRGKKSLRSDEWQEVAEKVSEKSKIERTDTQCRNRLDTLKKKYKGEKIKLAEAGGGTSKWVYFKKMDMLMSTSAQQGGFSCRLDGGEYAYMNPAFYSNGADGSNEMRDSVANSDEDDSDGLPPKKRRLGRECNKQSPFGLLADSIQKFSEIYEKIENSKRQQMSELEKMRMDFHRDLEMQKRQIIERAQAEIAKIQQGGEEEEDDISANSA